VIACASKVVSGSSGGQIKLFTYLLHAYKQRVPSA
jgi:hypothetical protein